MLSSLSDTASTPLNGNMVVLLILSLGVFISALAQFLRLLTLLQHSS